MGLPPTTNVALIEALDVWDLRIVHISFSTIVLMFVVPLELTLKALELHKTIPFPVCESEQNLPVGNIDIPSQNAMHHDQ